MKAIYFSGTGNTKYALDRLCNKLNINPPISIENIDKANAELNNANTIIIAYPIYSSDMPAIVKEFLANNAQLFKQKRLIVLVTQLFFSGDGASLVARHLKKHGVRVKLDSTIHINMPSNISDLTIFKVKNGEQNQKKLLKADKKIDICAKKINGGKKIKNGRHFYSWFIGFFSQRLWHRLFLEKKLKSSLKIDPLLCVKCGKCKANCPTKNIEITTSITQKNNCTLCYRCINLCPKRAISLLSCKKPKQTYRGVNNENKV